MSNYVCGAGVGDRIVPFRFFAEFVGSSEISTVGRKNHDQLHTLQFFKSAKLLTIKIMLKTVFHTKT